MHIMDSEDENDVIEAEIQQQLQSLTLPNHDLTWNEEDEDEVQITHNNDDDALYEHEHDEREGGTFPESIQSYLDVVNKRSEGLQRDLEECQHLLNNTVQVVSDADYYYQSAEMKEIAFILGEDPEELRDRVLAEVEQEEDNETVHINHTIDGVTSLLSSQHEGTHIKDDECIISREADTLQQVAWQQLLQLDEKLKQQHIDIQQDIQQQSKQQSMIDEFKLQDRSRKQKQHADELKQVQQDREILQARVEKEIESDTRKNQEIFNKQQAKIDEFTKQTERERLEFERHIAADKEHKLRQRYHAATLIQASFRSYRVRKKYQSRLHRLKEERQQRKLQNRQMEIVAMRRAEEQKKKREKAEKKQKEADQRKRNEELHLQAEKERRKQEGIERKRIADEKEKLELAEQQRLQEEKRLHEEQLKQQRELEEKTQEILAKIAQDRADITSSDGKYNDDGARTVNEEPCEVFITTSKVSQSRTVMPIVNEHVASLRSTTPDLRDLRLEDTSHVINETANCSSECNTADLEQSLSQSDQHKLTPEANQVQPDLENIAKPETLSHDVISMNEKPETLSHDAISMNEKPETLSHDAISLNEKPETLSHDAISMNEKPETLSHDAISMNEKPETLSHDAISMNEKPETLSHDAISMNEQAVTEDSIVNHSNDTSQSLPTDINTRRLHWMHNCVSHSSVVSAKKCNETRKPLRRVHRDNKLPVLTSSQLLAASHPQTQLSQVSIVVVESAAPCSLSSLRSCPNLQCLHIQQCGVVLLGGIEQCASISYIDLQRNNIEGISCRDRTELNELLLQYNKLTSVHGLEGCVHLRYLQLSHNSITRTDGLQSLISITHLDLSNNQLVSINGLGHLIHVQDLNLSHNHLSTVHELETCCLLQRLNIQGNSLVEMPPVQNHVLLCNVNVNDNSLTSIEPMSAAWLPLLQCLSLAQNGLLNLTNMKYCPMLKNLDVSNNCITDYDVVVDALQECHYLEELRLEGNPLSQEDGYRSNILGGLASVRLLDNETIQELSPSRPPQSPYIAMCLSQLQCQDQLHAAYQQHKQSMNGDSASSIFDAHQVKSVYLECSLQQALQQRHMHEQGEMTQCVDTTPGSVESTFYDFISRQSEKCSSDSCSESAPGVDGQIIRLGQGHNHTQISSDRLAPGNDHTQIASDRLAPGIDHTQIASDRLAPGNDHTQIASERLAPGIDHTQIASERLAPGNDHTQIASERLAPGNDHTQIASERLAPGNDHTQIASNRLAPGNDHTQIASERLAPGIDHTQIASERLAPGNDHTQIASNRLPSKNNHSQIESVRHESELENTQTAFKRNVGEYDCTHIAWDRAQSGSNRPSPCSPQHVPSTVPAEWTSLHTANSQTVSVPQPHQQRNTVTAMQVDWLAALRIQASWRGYRVRRRVAAARQAVRYHDSDDEDNNAMMYDEVDPTDWDLAQANIDSDWLPAETASIPRLHPCIPATHKPSNEYQHTPQPPRHVWNESPVPHFNLHSPISQLVTKPPIPPVHTSPSSETPRTVRSNRQDQLTEEWGFKDTTTAELMMKRAKKLTKGGSKKKVLDPLQRYHKTKKVQHSASLVPSPKKGIQRQEFFQAREQEIQKASSAQKQEKEHKEARTLQWVHSHADMNDDSIYESSRHSSSEPNLPIMSQHVLQGRVQLMASPSLELQSVDGASSVSSLSHRPRSHSLSSPQGLEEIRLPSIKTNSAPSGRSRERQGMSVNKKAKRGWSNTNNNQV